MKTIFCMEEVFRGRMFQVPDYQRGYTWEEAQWQDLIEDLELLPLGRNHYTGTLVLRMINQNGKKLRDENGVSYDLFDIIDGQQRLTTIVLLLDTIHDEMVRVGQQKLAEGLESNYLVVKNQIGMPRTKLLLNRDCQEYFYDLMIADGSNNIGGPKIWSHKQLKGAHVYFASYLSTQCAARKDGYSDWLCDLHEKVTQHLSVLLYETETDTEAGVIFETMNDRGKQLTELEKVKNYLLYAASKLDLPVPHNLAEKVNATWTDIFEALMAAGLGDEGNEDQLLRMHWLMAYDSNPKNWDSSRSIKERFSLRKYHDKHANLLKDLLLYLDSLKNATLAYCDIMVPDQRGAFNDFDDPVLRAGVVQFSIKFARLGARVNFLPLLMAVRMKTRDGGGTYRQIIELVEKIDFRLYQWSKYRAFTAQYNLFRIGFDYYRRPDPERLPAALIRVAHEYCTNEQFAERFDLATENWYAWRGLKYFLYEYEQHLAQEKRMPLHYKWEEISGEDVKHDTIEHILPQSREDRYWKSRFTPKKHQRWVNDIGNLTLTFDNPTLGAHSFLRKKGSSEKDCCYTTSKLFIEQALAKYSDWTEKQIQERRDEIREWSLKRWFINPPPAVDPNETTEARILRLASENGTLQEFQMLLQAGQELPVYVRFQKNWNSISFTPPHSKTTTLIAITPELEISFGLETLVDYCGITEDRLEEMIGEEPNRRLDPSEVGNFIASLKRLFEHAVTEEE